MKIFYYLFLYLLILETLASQVVPYLQIPIIDKNNGFAGYIFPGDSHIQTAGWPNESVGGQEIIRPSKLNKEEFNSPHGLTADKDGNLYIAEWLIGGRITKLKLMV